MAQAEQLTAQRAAVSAPAIARPAAAGGIALAVLGLAALSFLLPSAPTYDPWAWIIWGREIAAPRPLDDRRPVVEAAAGDAHDDRSPPPATPRPTCGCSPRGPARWPASCSRFRVARAPGRHAGRGRRRRRLRAAPWTLRNAALGNSEGLLVALALAAVDRHARRRAAGPRFALGARRRPPAAGGLAVARALRRLAGLARRRAHACSSPAGLAAMPICGCCPSLGLGRPAARAAPRPGPARGQPRLRRQPRRRGAPPVLEHAHRAAVVGCGARRWPSAVAARAPTRAELRLAGARLAGGVIWVAEVAA